MPMANEPIDSAPPKVDWRFALTCTLLLTLLFAVQQSLASTGTGREISLPTALQRQTVIWFVWLGLLPAMPTARHVVWF